MAATLPPPPTPPKVLTGRELYDAVMLHIEPELVSSQAPLLAEKYKNESPADRAERMKRYELAFERCDQACDEYLKTLDAQISRYQREAFTHAELSDRRDDEGFLSKLGSVFSPA